MRATTSEQGELSHHMVSKLSYLWTFYVPKLKCAILMITTDAADWARQPSELVGGQLICHALGHEESQWYLHVSWERGNLQHIIQTKAGHQEFYVGWTSDHRWCYGTDFVDKHFPVIQGQYLPTIYQENKRTILLAENRNFSGSKYTCHLNTRYFFDRQDQEWQSQSSILSLKWHDRRILHQVTTRIIIFTNEGESSHSACQ